MFKKLFGGILLFVVLMCCDDPKKACASSSNDPTLGGCIICETYKADGTCDVCKLSAHSSVIQPLAVIDLKDGTLYYGISAVSPGACYGVTYGPTKWYASGGSFCLNIAKTDSGNMVFPSGILQLVKWGMIGLGGLCSDGYSTNKDKLVCHATLLFGANVSIE
jgi:hypothetical protein